MKTIFKYILKGDSISIISLPIDAKILTAAIQNKSICIWAEVETDTITEERFFEIFGTGWEMSQNMGVERKYINTVFDGPYVWHVYERI
jgi:hypothetical protein